MTTKTEWFSSVTVSTTSASMMNGFVHSFMVVMGVVEFRYYNFNLFFFMSAITLQLKFSVSLGKSDLPSTSSSFDVHGRNQGNHHNE